MGTGTQTDRDKTAVDQPGTDQSGTINDQDDKSGTKKKSGSSDQGDRTTGTDKSKKKSSDRMNDQGDRVSGTDKSGAKSGQGKQYQGDKDKDKGTTVTTYTHTPDDQDDRKDRDRKDRKYRKDRDRDKTDVTIRDRDRDRDWDNDQDDELSIPEKVRNAFSGAYTNAKASWKREGNNFRAMFRNGKDKDALTTIVVYDKEGNVLVTEREIKHNSCPEEIEKFCARDRRIWKVETKDAPIKYFIQDDDEHMWYDSKGNRIGGSDRDRDVGAISPNQE